MCSCVAIVRLSFLGPWFELNGWRASRMSSMWDSSNLMSLIPQTQMSYLIDTRQMSKPFRQWLPKYSKRVSMWKRDQPKKVDCLCGLSELCQVSSQWVVSIWYCQVVTESRRLAIMPLPTSYPMTPMTSTSSTMIITMTPTTSSFYMLLLWTVVLHLFCPTMAIPSTLPVHQVLRSRKWKKSLFEQI